MDREHAARLYTGISVSPEKEANPAVCDTGVGLACTVLHEIRQTEGEECV